MIKFLSRVSTRYAWAVILITIGITGFMFYQIRTNLRVEPDMTKFLPNSMPTTKANDFYKKNYNYQDSMMIGLEAIEGTLMEPSKLRVIEGIIDQINGLKVEKSFESKLTGKKETRTFSLGIDTENISSLPGLEDALLDSATGSVVSGSLVKKFKDDLKIAYEPNDSERLPKSDADLARLIPLLEKRIMSDSLFVGNVLSEDKRASTIRVPMVRKWDYKRRYTILELKTGLDPEQLKRRFQGNDSAFPFEIYGKRVGLVTYDDAFIAKHSADLAKELQAHLTGVLKPLFSEYPELQDLLSKPMTGTSLDQVLKIVDQREFNLHHKMITWENFTNGLWEFTLDAIDPASREGLEFQLYNVRDVVDLALVYDKVNEVLAKFSNGIHFYVAGSPVVTAVFSQMIGKDMGLLLPIGVLVIFVILALSFRSARGVVIPLVTVVLSMIWALGSMAITKIPVTAMSSILPIVLLAVGSAYGIHLLNRYAQDILERSDKRDSVRYSTQEVGVAILMAGMTTVAGFLSLASSDLSMIQHFGVFAALGVVYALALTLTFSPALLVYWRLPRSVRKSAEGPRKLDVVDRIFMKIADVVITYPKPIVLLFVVGMVGALIVIPRLQLEGGQMDNFKDGNQIKESDRFISRNLTGTGLFNIIFTFRDEADLTGPWAQKELAARSQKFSDAMSQYLQTLQNIKLPLSQPLQVSDPASLKKQLDLFADLFNEEFVAEIKAKEGVAITQDESSLDALDALDSLDAASASNESSSETEGLDGLDGLAEQETALTAPAGPFPGLNAEQVAGLELLNQRLGGSDGDFQANGQAILDLRRGLSSSEGKQMRRAFNELRDLFAADIKQPHVLHRLVELRNAVEALKTPVAHFADTDLKPTGFVATPVDLVRKFYRVFYHDDNPAFDRLPNVETDNLADQTMTDRSVIGVVLNQAQSGSRETFDGMISPDLKEFQINILTRKEASSFVVAYQDQLHQILKKEFPENDPYIKRVTIAGFAPTSTELTLLISNSQIKSIAAAFVLVFGVTFFIFRSVLGGLLSILPLLITVLGNFGTMWLLGWKINTGTMLVASISIGIGVDYTIHFLERYKIQLRNGEDLQEAYRNTIKGVGKAVLINALSVAFGFLVLIASDFVGNQAMGILMAGTMIYSSIGALIFLPALIFWIKPKIFTVKKNQTTSEPIAA